DRTLLLTELSTNQARNYFAVASNLFGVATSTVATVTVPFPPQLTLNLMNQVADSGNDLELQVSAQGAAPLSFTWTFRGRILAGQTASKLALTNVQPSQSGVYNVRASNGDGSAVSTMSLTVFPPPGNL